MSDDIIKPGDEDFSIPKPGVGEANHLKGRAIGSATKTGINLWAQMDVKMLPDTSNVRGGFFLRAVDGKNFLACHYDWNAGSSTSIVQAYPIIAGAEVAGGGAAFGYVPWDREIWTTIAWGIVGNKVVIWAGPKGGLLVAYASGEIPTLLTTLKEGGIYLYDENQNATFVTRLYDNITVWEAVADSVNFAGRSMEIRSDGIFRQDSAAEVWGRIVPDSGQYPYAPPSRMEERQARGIIIPSSGDFDRLPDSKEPNKVSHKAIYMPGYHFVGEAGASTYLELFIKRAKELGASYILAPTSTTGPLTNLGLSAPYAPAAKREGAAIMSATALVPGGTSISLPGTGGSYLDTTWITQLNECRNPTGSTASTAEWGGSGATIEAVNFAEKGIPNLVLPQGTIKTGFKVDATSGAGSRRTMTWPGITAGKRYRGSIYIYVTNPGNLGPPAAQFKVRVRDNVPNTVQEGVGTSLTNQWIRVDVDFTAALTATHTFEVLQTTNGGVAQWYMTGGLMEEAPELRQFFPLASQLESGEAIHTGAAGLSTSYIGPFAPGTSRTFVAVGTRPNPASGFDELFGGSLLPPYIGAGNNTPVLGFSADGTEFEQWFEAWPQDGKVKHAAFSFDNVANAVFCYVNGKPFGGQTHTKDFLGPSAGSLLVGAGGGATSVWQGSMLPVAVFPKALTQEQIESLYL